MPFGAYDPGGRALAEFRSQDVSVVVLLASDEECRHRAGRVLRRDYEAEGLEVIHRPLPDFGVPPPEEVPAFRDAVGAALHRLRQGRHMVIHCYAGKGRTGLFAACLARVALGLPADGAMAWIRRAIPGAVETEAQARLVRDLTP